MGNVTLWDWYFWKINLYISYFHILSWFQDIHPLCISSWLRYRFTWIRFVFIFVAMITSNIHISSISSVIDLTTMFFSLPRMDIPSLGREYSHFFFVVGFVMDKCLGNSTLAQCTLTHAFYNVFNHQLFFWNHTLGGIYYTIIFHLLYIDSIFAWFKNHFPTCRLNSPLFLLKND